MKTRRSHRGFKFEILLLLLLANCAPNEILGFIQVYTDKADFLAATGAESATGPLPNIGELQRGQAYTIGTVTLSAPNQIIWIGARGVPPPYTGDWTVLIPGNDISIAGSENLDASFERPVIAAGFDFVEPTGGPGVCCPVYDSRFSVTLRMDGAMKGTFEFNAPNNTLAFIGVLSDTRFNSIEIREIFGDQDDEYFGQFYTAELAATDIGIHDITTKDFHTFRVDYRISNHASPSFQMTAYLSADEILDPFDQQIHGEEIWITNPDDLSAGIDGSPREHSVELEFSNMAPISEDSRFVILFADSQGVIDELDESNNSSFAVPLFLDGWQRNRSFMSTGESHPDASGGFVRNILRGTRDFDELVRLDSFPAEPPFPWGTSPFVFALPDSPEDEDRLVQPSLLAPVRRLVSTWRADWNRRTDIWGEFLVSINEAFDSAGDHKVGSLHYEGRALDLDVIPAGPGVLVESSGDGYRLGRLAGIAWLAGFDWVYFESSHVHVSERGSILLEALRSTGSGRRGADPKRRGL